MRVRDPVRVVCTPNGNFFLCPGCALLARPLLHLGRPQGPRTGASGGSLATDECLTGTKPAAFGRPPSRQPNVRKSQETQHEYGQKHGLADQHRQDPLVYGMWRYHHDRPQMAMGGLTPSSDWPWLSRCVRGPQPFARIRASLRAHK